MVKSECINKVLLIAQNELGYLEKASNSNLENKTGNAGSGNYTKYWADLSPSLQGQAWCNCFTNYIFKQAFGQEKALKMLYMSSWTYYTPTSSNYFKQNNAWVLTPEKGDLIYFKNDTRICHIGIVYQVEGQYVYTIEGNTSSKDEVVANGGGVFAKKYLLTNSRIAGYGRPKWSEVATSSNSIPVSVYTPSYKGIDVSACQGTINWAQVKNSGISYAFLRSTVKTKIPDSTFEYNYSNCISNNIPVGVYKYSYALTENESVAEAQSVISLLNGRPLQCGVWLDLEWKNQRLIGSTNITKIVKAFMTVIQSAGYKVGIYCNKDWYENVLDTKSLQYDYWIARYPKEDDGTIHEDLRLSYGTIWQYSSKGSILGINDNVDLNTTYTKFWNTSTTTTSSTAVAGSSNTAIKDVQQQLNKNYNLSIAEDNIFGNETKKALAKAYQIELNKSGCGLIVDGDFGTLSCTAYNNKVHFQMANSTGVFTALWQMVLICYGFSTVKVTGVFNGETAARTYDLQKKLGLTPNYIVDSITVSKAI